MNTPKESPRSRRMLSTTLGMAFFSLSAAGLLLFVTLATFSGFRIHESVLSGRQQLIAQDAAKTVNSFINENFSILETAAWLTDLDIAPEEQQGPILKSLLGFRSAFRGIFFLSTDDRIMVMASRLSMNAMNQLTDRIKDFLKGRSGRAGRKISQVFIDPATNEPMVIMAVPVTDVFGDFKGTLVAELKLKPMWDIVDRLKVGETGYIYVSDKKGNLLAFEDTARVLKGENLSHIKAVADFIHDQDPSITNTATHYKGIRGSTVVGTYTPLKTPDWAVVTELPWKEAYRGIIRGTGIAVGLAVVLAALSCIFGMLMARRLAAPVINLTQTATRIAAGERDLTATVKGPKEIVRLADAFNSMTAQLRQSLLKLERRFADLKRTEEALQESRRLLATLMGNLPGMAYRCKNDPDWTMEFVSNGCRDLTGYRPEELIGNALLSYAEVIHPEDRRMVQDIIQEALKNRRPFQLTYRITSFGKEEKWVWEQGHGSFDKEGNPTAIEGFIADITAQKKAEEALHYSLEKFEKTFQAAPIMVVLSSLEEGRYLEVNEAFLSDMGYKREEVIGKTSGELQNWVDPNDRRRIVNSLEERGRIRNAEVQLRTRSGEIIYTLFSAEAIDLEGERVMISVSRDVTQQKHSEEERERLQEQLLQAQKMESVGRLAGGVAHDFNNMLSVIIGHSELALMQLEPTDSLHGNIEEILSAAKRSMNITRQLLAFARRQTISPRVLDLNEAVEVSLKMLRRLIGENIDLAWHPSMGLWPVKVDSGQIDQILANLCVNARDAIDDVGKITIETDKALFDEDYCADHPGFVPGEFVMLAVSDNGCGMDKESQDKIFEPFFTTKKVGMGTGLGLATVYGIVKQNNGFINVYSEQDQGTTFRIYLPRYEGPVIDEQTADIEEIPGGHGETVLVVEDETSILKLVLKVLSELEYTVISAENPAEALETAEAHSGEISLLITDVIMPEMNGSELAERLKAIHPELKCLFMSGYTADVISHHGVLKEGVDFLQKPFSRSELAHKVRFVLDNTP